MRVLHISAGNLFGGVETVLVTMARERRQCPDLKPHFSVCFEDRFSRELRATGAPVDYVGNVRARNPFTVLRARAALDRRISQEAVDVAVCHSPWAHSVFSPVVKSHRLPLIFWSHGFLDGKHWLEIWARQTKPALVICNSRTTEASTAKLFPQIPSQVIYAPVSEAAPPRTHFPSDSGDESKPVIILQVSRMEQWKGHALLLEGLSMLKDLSNWICWFVGGAQTDREAGYETDLHSLAGKLGVSDRVQFLGDREVVPELMSQADIFCQPNLTPEPFGIVFIEALQAGLPVVSVNLGGVSEIVTEACGILVPPKAPGLLANALRGLITDARKRKELGLGGPARAHALCDPKRQLERLHEVLQSLF